MLATWQETTRGPALRIQVDEYHVSFYPFDLEDPVRVAKIAAISLWEGAVGLCPRGRFARWRWRRGLRSFERKIEKEVRNHTTE